MKEKFAIENQIKKVNTNESEANNNNNDNLNDYLSLSGNEK
jgi:hypothetical protein